MLSNVPGNVDTVTTLARAPETVGLSALVPVGFMERGLLDFSLLTLPLDVQQVYRIILMVPLAIRRDTGSPVAGALPAPKPKF